MDSLLYNLFEVLMSSNFITNFKMYISLIFYYFYVEMNKDWIELKKM